jgi:hypothetical protein
MEPLIYAVFILVFFLRHAIYYQQHVSILSEGKDRKVVSGT